MFFVGWEMQYNENHHSYGQLAINSFIMTMCTIMPHVSCRDFWWNIKSHRWLSPSTAQIGALQLLSFSKTEITFEREEILDYQWDSGKFARVADGESNKGFCIGFWTVEETLEELCEVPRCLLWRNLRHHCPMYNVSCIFFNKCLYYS